MWLIFEGAYQLQNYHAADPHLCSGFAIPPYSLEQSFKPLAIFYWLYSIVCVLPGLKDTQETEFLRPTLKYHMSHCIRKPTKCLGENKGADQLRGSEADQRLCFRYTDSTTPLLLKSEISSF